VGTVGTSGGNCGYVWWELWVRLVVIVGTSGMVTDGTETFRLDNLESEFVM
jgi:hypothetical protein